MSTTTTTTTHSNTSGERAVVVSCHQIWMNIVMKSSFFYYKHYRTEGTKKRREKHHKSARSTSVLVRLKMLFLFCLYFFCFSYFPVSQAQNGTMCAIDALRWEGERGGLGSAAEAKVKVSWRSTTTLLELNFNSFGFCSVSLFCVLLRRLLEIHCYCFFFASLKSNSSAREEAICMSFVLYRKLFSLLWVLCSPFHLILGFLPSHKKCCMFTNISSIHPSRYWISAFCLLSARLKRFPKHVKNQLSCSAPVLEIA